MSSARRPQEPLESTGGGGGGGGGGAGSLDPPLREPVDVLPPEPDGRVPAVFEDEPEDDRDDVRPAPADGSDDEPDARDDAPALERSWT